MDRTHPMVLVLNVRSNSAVVISVKGFLDPTIPAFANITSNRPYLSTASSMTAFTDGSSPASNCLTWTSTPGYND